MRTEEAGHRSKLLGLKSVTVIMVMVEFLDVGLNILSKAAMKKGMSNFVFVVYANALALFVLLPSSFFFYSSGAQLLKFIGINYSSPTMASAMIDLMPAFTFILAVITGMEILDLRITSRQAKCIGTVVSISGALMLTLYKGLPLIRADASHSKLISLQLLLSSQTNWFIGGIVLAFQSFLLAMMHIAETWVIRDYPAVLMVTTIRNAKDWYSFVGTNIKGPVYVAMFKPLGLVMALFVGVAFLGDTLYLGRLLGAAITVVGFYAVIWGKAQEEKEKAQNDQTGSFESFPQSEAEPLLPKRCKQGTEEKSLLERVFLIK
ncbi:nodulin MtN21 /EamA-like transporter family protein, partial [Prunus dulcis]